MLEKGSKEEEVGFLELPSNQILNHYSTLLEIEKIRKGPLDLFG